MNILIRPLTIEDSAVSYKWRNDPEVWMFTGSKPTYEITEKIERDWLEQTICDSTKSRFAIVVNNIYVGNVQLTDIKLGETAEFHIFIGDKSFWGKGVSKEATYQILTYANEVLKLKQVFLDVSKENLAAIKSYKKNGFVISIEKEKSFRMVCDIINLSPPLLSIFCMVYNHENYISQCLDGFLMQKTNFSTVIVLGEDCSTDGSRDIIIKYAKNYPGKFKLLLHKENIGAHKNQEIVFENCKGKYVAMCEGDDYWTDPLKLQKQVDFLEENEEYVLCGHIVDKLNYEGEIDITENLYQDFSFTQNQLYKTHIPTLSAVFRNKFDVIPNEFLVSPSGDFILWSYLGQFGSFYMFSQKMAIYREHVGGVWSGVNLVNKIKNSVLTRHFALNFMTDKKDTLIFNKRLIISGAYQSFRSFDFKNLFFFINYYIKSLLL